MIGTPLARGPSTVYHANVIVANQTAITSQTSGLSRICHLYAKHTHARQSDTKRHKDKQERIGVSQTNHFAFLVLAVCPTGSLECLVVGVSFVFDDDGTGFPDVVDDGGPRPAARSLASHASSSRYASSARSCIVAFPRVSSFSSEYASFSSGF